MSEMTQAFLTSNDQTWATPWPVIRALEAEGFNFTLDVAAGPKSTKAHTFYTEEEDAFKQNWPRDAGRGDAWCNPPYGEHLGKTVGDWAQEAWKYRITLRTVLLLPCNKQDQDWYHDLVVPDGQYRPVRGRIPFVDPETGLPPKKWKVDPKTGIGRWVTNGNSQGSMLIIFGPDIRPCAPITFDYRVARRLYKEAKAA